MLLTATLQVTGWYSMWSKHMLLCVYSVAHLDCVYMVYMKVVYMIVVYIIVYMTAAYMTDVYMTVVYMMVYMTVVFAGLPESRLEKAVQRAAEGASSYPLCRCHNQEDHAVTATRSHKHDRQIAAKHWRSL